MLAKTQDRRARRNSLAGTRMGSRQKSSLFAALVCLLQEFYRFWGSDGIGSFLPVTLEQLSRERGVLRSDPSRPCTAVSKDDAAPTIRSLLFARDGTDLKDNQCIVHIFGSEVNTASFAMYTFSMAVFVQAITLVSISAIADHGRTYVI